MKTVNLTQGTKQWLEHRRQHFNASDSPAMMGESKYKTRDQLLLEIKTGITPNVDAATQRRFDEGHRIEALARPLAEKIIGDELSPVTCEEGKLSASLDGITFDGSVIFEHKTLNKDLLEVFADIETRAPEYRDNSGDLLPLMYRIQMEQQLMISEAEKCLFMASKWDGDTLIEERHTWYTPDAELRSAILQGWTQFAIDLENFVPPKTIEKVIAETVETLPVPSVVVSGSITKSNLAEITPLFDNYLSNINTSLSTDQDFADAEANAKNCRETAKRIKSLRENIIAQMADVNAVDSALNNYEEAFNKVGLQLEKAVKEQKETLKTNAVLKAQNEYANFVDELSNSVDYNLVGLLTKPDFGAAIKGVKTIESMQSRLNDAVAKGKSDASVLAKEVKAKLAYIAEAGKGYEHLITPMTSSFMTYSIDHIKLGIQSVKDAEDKRKAEHEARIKAQAEADARAKLEREALEAQREKEAEDQRANAKVAEASPSPAVSETVSSSPVKEVSASRPSDDEMIDVLSLHYRAHESKVIEWLLDMDLNEASRKLAA